MNDKYLLALTIAVAIIGLVILLWAIDIIAPPVSIAPTSYSSPSTRGNINYLGLFVGLILLVIGGAASYFVYHKKNRK